jgi:hypothetical protein
LLVKPFSSREWVARVSTHVQIHRSREDLDRALKGADLGTWKSNVQTGEFVHNDHTDCVALNATASMKANNNPHLVAAALGHESIAVTMRYYVDRDEVEASRQQAAVNALVH